MMPENGHPMTSRSTAPHGSTYRLQLTDHFTLHDAVNVVPYLSELGVGALYLSPLLKAVAGLATWLRRRGPFPGRSGAGW